MVVFLIIVAIIVGVFYWLVKGGKEQGAQFIEYAKQNNFNVTHRYPEVSVPVIAIDADSKRICLNGKIYDGDKVHRIETFSEIPPLHKQNRHYYLKFYLKDLDTPEVDVSFRYNQRMRDNWYSRILALWKM